MLSQPKWKQPVEPTETETPIEPTEPEKPVEPTETRNTC